MIKNWDKKYEEGVHWGKKPSDKVKEFIYYLKPKDRVLEIGCGDGTDSIFLASYGYNVVGIDISSVALKKSKKNAKKFKSKAVFERGNVNELKYKNNQFDAIYSKNVLNFTDFNKSFKELARVLKRGKLAYITIITMTKFERLSKHNNKLDYNNLIGVVSKYFNIKEKSAQGVYEDDSRGKHFHEVLTLILEKR